MGSDLVGVVVIPVHHHNEAIDLGMYD